MNSEELKERFNNLTLWKRGGERAPHKPLLALYAIGRALRGEPRMVEYAKVDADLGKLLVEFGPRRRSYHPEYPFWRLQNDGLWELTRTEGLTTRRGNTDAKKSELLEHNVEGAFRRAFIGNFPVTSAWPAKSSRICSAPISPRPCTWTFSTRRHRVFGRSTVGRPAKPGFPRAGAARL